MSVFKHVTKEQLADPGIRWIDARFSLQDVEAGRRQYDEGHVRGAVYWDLERDLSDMTAKGGRHPLPSQDKLTALFRKSGLRRDDNIIVYDGGGQPFAARAWWILQYAGFRNAFISLEGFDSLEGMQADINQSPPIVESTTVMPEWDESILALKTDVEELTKNPEEGLLIDARAAERYRGEVEPLDRVAGHIPGAKNFEWSQLTTDGAFDCGGKAAGRFAELAASSDPVTVYCGSGVTAAPLFAMLKEKGVRNVRLYAGSYSDWIEDGDKEVEVGNNGMGDDL